MTDGKKKHHPANPSGEGGNGSNPIERNISRERKNILDKKGALVLTPLQE